MSIKSKPKMMLAAGLLAAGFSGCSPKYEATGGGIRVETGILPEAPLIGGGAHVMPRAVVYRMSGDCAELVPVTLSEDGTRVQSYPAPSDLRENSTPVSLGEGWWLDRRGVTANSVFTDYTYSEYRSLRQAPSAEELMSHIDSGCTITRMVVLPVTASEAAANPTVAKDYIRNGFKDCKEIPMKK